MKVQIGFVHYPKRYWKEYYQCQYFPMLLLGFAIPSSEISKFSQPAHHLSQVSEILLSEENDFDEILLDSHPFEDEPFQKEGTEGVET